MLSIGFILPPTTNYKPFRQVPLTSLYLFTILEQEFKDKISLDIIDLRGISEENPKFDMCVDIGGGMGPMHLILSNYGKIVNVDDCSAAGGKRSPWYPADKNGIFYEESDGFNYIKENIEYVDSEFIKYIKTVPDNSVDLFIDGCSLIHMGAEARFSLHDGVHEIASNMKRTLKPGGYFISTSDIYNPGIKNNYPNILRHDGVTYPDVLYNIYKDCGLTALDAADFEVEDFYKDYNNALISVPGAPFHKRLYPAYSQRKHLPDYHAFSQIQDFPMLLARFVFTKK